MQTVGETDRAASTEKAAVGANGGDGGQRSPDKTIIIGDCAARKRWTVIIGQVLSAFSGLFLVLPAGTVVLVLVDEHFVV